MARLKKLNQHPYAQIVISDSISIDAKLLSRSFEGGEREIQINDHELFFSTNKNKRGDIYYKLDRVKVKDIWHNFTTAPYNFVPVPEKVVPAEPPIEHDVYGGQSGYISLSMTNEIDLFIGGGGHDFYKINDRYAIPGSSLRGLTRSLVEILSYARIGKDHIKDNPVYYREISNWKYRNKLISGTGEDQDHPVLLKMRPGYIVFKGNEPGIIWSNKLPVLDSDEEVEFYRIGFRAVKKEKGNNGQTLFYSGSRSRVNVELEKTRTNRTIYFKKNKIKVIEHNKAGRKSSFHRYAAVTDYTFRSSYKNADDIEGRVIVTGEIYGKHMHWVIGLPSSEHRQLTKEDRRILLEDKDYKGMYKDKLLNSTEENPEPCFVLLDDNDNIKGISHTPFMRMRYDNTIGDLLGKQAEDSNSPISIDIAEAIFGKMDASTSGKVRCGDLLRNDDPIKMGELTMTKILGSPRPSSYQLYLKGNQRGKTQNFDEATEIKGLKRYYHQSIRKPFADDIKISEIAIPKHLQEMLRAYPPSEGIRFEQGSIKIPNKPHIIKELLSIWEDDKLTEKVNPQNNPITPLGAGNTFTGRIYYDNLTEVELGALLFALDLPSPLRHKIGRSKSTGLGTVKINVDSVQSIDRSTRYRQLWGEDGSQCLGEAPLERSHIAKLKETFEEYLHASGIPIPLWPVEGKVENHRIYQLYLLMDPQLAKDKNWVDMIQHGSLQGIDKFNKRNPLLTPEQQYAEYKKLYDKN